MKKYLLPVVLLFALVSCHGKTRTEPETTDPKKTETPTQRNDLPNMEITFLDGTKTQARDLKGKVMLVMFFPDCEHCQEEAREIEAHLKSFDNYTLYFLASVPKEDIHNFAVTYKLNGKSNIKFGIVRGESVINNFGPIPTPSMYIYNDQRLMKQFEGQTDVNIVIGAL